VQQTSGTSAAFRPAIDRRRAQSPPHPSPRARHRPVLPTSVLRPGLKAPAALVKGDYPSEAVSSLSRCSLLDLHSSSTCEIVPGSARCLGASMFTIATCFWRCLRCIGLYPYLVAVPHVIMGQWSMDRPKLDSKYVRTLQWRSDRLDPWPREGKSLPATASMTAAKDMTVEGRSSMPSAWRRRETFPMLRNAPPQRRGALLIGSICYRAASGSGLRAARRALRRSGHGLIRVPIRELIKHRAGQRRERHSERPHCIWTSNQLRKRLHSNQSRPSGRVSANSQRHAPCGAHPP